jgi:hypothetical protein
LFGRDIIGSAILNALLETPANSLVSCGGRGKKWGNAFP